MLVQVNGKVAPASPKDIVLAIIGKIGTAGGTGYTIEFWRSHSRPEHGRPHDRLTWLSKVAHAGLVAVDDKTMPGWPLAPTGAEWDAAVAYWKLHSDADDRVVELNAADIVPQVTWGTSPEMVLGVDA
nr:3-isopropylmalate dehydratase large subunit [Staphylococcus epidermidis]